MFRATTTGLPNSRSCSVRYRFRSSADASTTSTMTSTWSLKIKLRETCSSIVYDVRLYVPGKSTRWMWTPWESMAPSTFSTVTPGQFATFKLAPV